MNRKQLDEACFYFVVGLYTLDRITIREAARLCKMAREEFLRRLPKTQGEA